MSHRMITDNSKKLAALFFGLNKPILMSEFKDKLEVQKTAYISQEAGISLGYPFEWYLKGPYCKQVSIDAHKILESNLQATPQDAGLDEEKVSILREMLEPYLNDSEWLEIASSLLYLRKENYAGKPLDQIIGYLLEDLTYGYKNFSEPLVRRVLADMVRIRLIQ